eukprot:6183064-Pleurochrysis_carterae.AAC.4
MATKQRRAIFITHQPSLSARRRRYAAPRARTHPQHARGAVTPPHKIRRTPARAHRASIHSQRFCITT